MKKFDEFIFNAVFWVLFEALPVLLYIFPALLIVLPILYFWFVVVLKIQWAG